MREFCNRALALVESQSQELTVRRRSGASDPFVHYEAARAILAKSVVRVAFLAFLQTRGWLGLDDREDFVFALYDRWRDDPKGYLFQQLVAQVFTTGLSRRSFESRANLEGRLGRGPNLGAPLVTESVFAADYSFDGELVVIPDAFWDEFLGESGFLRSGPPLSLRYEKGVLAADCMAHFYHGVRGTPYAELYEESAVARVRADLLHKEERTKGLSPSERVEKFLSIKVVDPSCGPGSVLIHTVRETMTRVERLCDEGGLPFDRSAMVRRVVERGLHGMDRDPFAVEVTRIRLALEVVANDPLPCPLPDLSRDVEEGDGVIVVSMFTAPEEMPPEGPQVEYKSTLEWDPREKKRSPALLYGVLRTIVAFLNTEGGVLYLGVGDDGNPKGLLDDFALINDLAKEDVFENRLREFLKRWVDPIPLAAVNVSFPEIAGIRVCQVVVRPRGDEVTYLTMANPKTQEKDIVFVRDGNRTIALRGRERDRFILGRGRA